MHFRKRTLPVLTLILSAIAILATGCRRQPAWQTDEGVVWHTTYRIIYQSDMQLADSIIRICNEVEQSLSPFKPTSLISRINRLETAETDTLLRRVFCIAQMVNRESAGRFDPTVAPLVDIWGFGTDTVARHNADNGVSFTVPQESLDSALMLVGLADCRIENGTMIKKHPRTSFNFSAVTKGVGCDIVAEMLQRNGVENYMVEIGGEIAANGHNPAGQPWRIQVDAPEEEDTIPGHKAIKIIALERGGVATSGNYRNFHRTDRYGKFGHTINPVTGMPATSEILSATVLAPTCGEADAWATACMATTTASDALSMLAAHTDVEAMLVIADGDSISAVFTPDCSFR